MKKRRLRIDFDPLFPDKEIVCGVYCMTFAYGRFYVGRSVNIRRRAIEHQFLLEKLLKEYKHSSDVPEYHYLKGVLVDLIENPDDNHLSISLAEECGEDLDSLLKCEQKWLNICAGEEWCVNLGFEAKPSSGDIRKINKLKLSRGC